MKNEFNLLTTQEVADLLNLRYMTVWRWSKDGTVKSYKIGKKVMFKRNEILEQFNL